MKGAHSRFLQRQGLNGYRKTLSIYEQVLDQVVTASGDGKRYRQPSENEVLQRIIKENEVYAFKCPDDDRYYRTIMVKRNFVSQQLQPMISTPVYGEIPDAIPEVDVQQVYKFMRLQNMTHLNAFPYRPGSEGSMQ